MTRCLRECVDGASRSFPSQVQACGRAQENVSILHRRARERKREKGGRGEGEAREDGRRDNALSKPSASQHTRLYQSDYWGVCVRAANTESMPAEVERVFRTRTRVRVYAGARELTRLRGHLSFPPPVSLGTSMDASPLGAELPLKARTAPNSGRE